MTDAVILAGGLGTRLRPAVSDVPKPLAPVNGRPFLDHQLAWLARGGVTRAIITAHHLADQIIRFAKDRNGFPIPIEVVREQYPLGTGGAVKNATEVAKVRGTAVVVNGDTYYRFNLAGLAAAHDQGNAPVTMAVARIDDCARYSTVEVCAGRVTRFTQAAGDRTPGMVNCGIYIMEAAAMADAPEGAFSMEYDFFPSAAGAGRLGAHIVKAETGNENANDGGKIPAFLDFGTPESYAAINQELGKR
ncbi:MAG: nucleotidyltransferase family protein [Rhodospirillales bacterium]